MVIVKIKNNEISFAPARDSFSRRVKQFENNILIELRRIGVDYNHVSEFKHPPIAIAPKRAHVEWGLGSSNCVLTVNKEKRYVDNLLLLSLCLKMDIDKVISKNMTLKEFEEKYAEHGDVHENRKWAREHLGLSEDCTDMDEINKKYKELAKKHHPDLEGGSVEMFKSVNEAHKILKRELD